MVGRGVKCSKWHCDYGCGSRHACKHAIIFPSLCLSPLFVFVCTSDVPGPAWAQSLGLGWALAGSGLPKPKPDPQLRAGPGLGLVGLKPGLMSQRSNRRKYYIKICQNAPRDNELTCSVHCKSHQAALRR